MITINGNGGNDTIKSHNAKFVLINGGKGNDSLWGGSGSDTFIYANGGDKDVVYNFGDEDALQIGGNFTATVNNNSIAFKIGSTANALTLKDYTATSFNINGATHTKSAAVHLRRNKIVIRAKKLSPVRLSGGFFCAEFSGTKFFRHHV